MNDSGTAIEAGGSEMMTGLRARVIEFHPAGVAISAGESTQTKTLQACIDEASAIGGAIVHVPAGVHRIGTIELKSHVTLRLAKGAVLQGSAELSDYPVPATGFVDAVGQMRGRCLIHAFKVRNAAIIGEGTIDGSGARFIGDAYAGRPFLVRLVESGDLLLKGITLSNAAAWVCHVDACQGVAIDGIAIRSRVNHNNDGIDIDSSRDVTVRDCDISTGDDAICLKATRERPCEDVLVEGCRLSSACGAIKLGTESYGDMRNIRIRDCDVYDTGLCAIKIISTDGAVIENVNIADITITNTTGPMFIRLGDRLRTYGTTKVPRSVGRVRNLTIERVKATVTVPKKSVENPWNHQPVPPAAFSGIVITGLPDQPVENLMLRDVSIGFVGGQPAKGTPQRPTEPSNQYPEHFYFGVLPAWAVYARYASGLTFENVSVTYLYADERPALLCDDVAGLKLIQWHEGPATA